MSPPEVKYLVSVCEAALLVTFRLPIVPTSLTADQSDRLDALCREARAAFVTELQRIAGEPPS